MDFADEFDIYRLEVEDYESKFDGFGDKKGASYEEEDVVCVDDDGMECDEPKTIFTDQDIAMAKALEEVMPDTWHGLCTWHSSQNATKHLAGVLQNHTTGFIREFWDCTYLYIDEGEFELEWEMMKVKYELVGNKWLDGTYKWKKSWAMAYMKSTFTLGIRSTQLSESLNKDLKDCLNCKINIVDFFSHFEKVVPHKRDNELYSDYRARQTTPHLSCPRSPILQQLAKRYTPVLLEYLEEEFDRASSVNLFKVSETPYLIEWIAKVHGDKRDRMFKVVLCPSTKVISCTCFKFETFGYLYGHALRAFDIAQIREMPEIYILKRWTRQARCGFENEYNGGMDLPENHDHDVNLLCSEFMRLAY